MSEFEKYEDRRTSIQNEMNKQIEEHISFEVYEKTPEERELLKQIKSDLKNK